MSKDQCLETLTGFKIEHCFIIFLKSVPALLQGNVSWKLLSRITDVTGVSALYTGHSES